MAGFAQALKPRIQEKMEFSIKVIAKPKGNGPIYLLHANDHSGDRAYYFFQAEPRRAPLFEKAMTRKGIADLEDYGRIIVSGYGEVSAKHIQLMSDKYGWQGEC